MISFTFIFLRGCRSSCIYELMFSLRLVKYLTISLFSAQASSTFLQRVRLFATVWYCHEFIVALLIYSSNYFQCSLFWIISVNCLHIYWKFLPSQGFFNTTVSEFSVQVHIFSCFFTFLLDSLSTYSLLSALNKTKFDCFNHI